MTGFLYLQTRRASQFRHRRQPADPGERVVSISVRESYCGKQLAQFAVQVVEGVTKKVRVGVDASLDLRLEQSAY